MILMYHKVDLHSPTEWWVTVNSFYRQMWELQSSEVVLLAHYDPANPKHVVITFDGVYQNVIKYAAPIMQEFGYPFELFIVGDWIGAPAIEEGSEPPAPLCSKEDLISLRKMGGRMQWHTNEHIDLEHVLDPQVIDREFAIPDEIRSLDPDGFEWLAYPHGNFNPVVVERAKHKFKGALSCNQGDDRSPYRMNRMTVTNETRLRDHRVSCIVASYNYGNFLVEAVESVLKQSVMPDEILISDDHSSDCTEEVGTEYSKRYGGLVRFNRNETNLGIVKHFNKAISLTSGKYVCILGGDNRFASNFIEKCVEILESDPTIAVVYTDFHFFGSRARVMYDTYPAERRGTIQNGYYQIIAPAEGSDDLERMKISNFIHGSSVFRRSVFDEVGGYLEKQDRPEDYDLFLRMLERGYRAVKCSSTFLEYRQHSRDQANIRHMSTANLLFYIEKCRRLEIELRKVETSFWRKVFFPLLFVARIAERANQIRKQGGLLVLLKKISGRLGRARKST